MLHTSGFPRAPLGPPEWADREGRARRVREVAAQLGARHRVRVPPDLGALGARRAHRAGLGQRLPRLRPRAGHRAARPAARASASRAASRRHRRAGRGAASRRRPTSSRRSFGVRELPVTEVTDDALLVVQPARRSAPSACPAGAASRPRPTSRSSTRRCSTTPASSGTPTCSPTPPAGCATRSPSCWRWARPPTAPSASSSPATTATPTGAGSGTTQSPRTFGHNGAGGQIAWADPDSGLSFGYVTNGRDRNPIREGRRSIGISSRAAVSAG